MDDDPRDGRSPAHLEERGEDVEGVDGAGAVRVRHQLVDVATPGLLGVVTHHRLEGGQDGREEGGGGRGKPQVLQVVRVVTEAVATETDGKRGCGLVKRN